ncbi:lytic transglycosylase domain-containing protein [Paracoccus sp. MC1862]|uniref:lytic transglycosylase domain-containing protein n=1 Tax=Paracoccus sp. MC1862 TaxID=2760307 RepID=UPI001F28AC0E|nr:lytic transglycosylase domain-containing protein [Paracoccus sp. MC1862]
MRCCFQLVVIAALAAAPVFAEDVPAAAMTVIAAADADAQAPLSDAAMDTVASDAPVVSDSPVPDAAAVPAVPAESPDVPPLTDPVALIGPPMPAPDTKDRRCTADGRSCIAVATYVADVCSTIEKAAGENRLDPNFLARLLWKESLFEPEAVSPAGALGIAQFMPGTARIRKLDDPMNPAKAIHASADYLRHLIDGFGNMGLAAVAYNGGEGRASSFSKGSDSLPYETRDYVEAITGFNAWKWRDDPPPQIDVRLDKDKPFGDACVQLAANRTLKEFSATQRSFPWGVILASHPRQSGVQQHVERLNSRLRPILGGKRITTVRKTMSGSGKRVYTAQVGYSSRTEANAFCSQFRALGGRCIVLKN